MISLTVDNLSKRYVKRTIINDLSFEHSQGVLGIAGFNGSGKSTLLKCVSYLARPTKGSFTWAKDGTSLSREQVKPLIGVAAPYINLYAELSARENVEFIAKLSKLDNYKTHLEELIDSLQISAFASQEFGSLSTGQQQRVKLAVALIRKPEILLLDEPGSNLDAKGHDLVVRIAEEAKANDTFLIIASNDPKEINLCDQVISL